MPLSDPDRVIWLGSVTVTDPVPPLTLAVAAVTVNGVGLGFTVNGTSLLLTLLGLVTTTR